MGLGTVFVVALLAPLSSGFRVEPRCRAVVKKQGLALRAGVTESEAAVKGSSATTSTLNLAKNIIGSGVLALPGGVAAFSDSTMALYPAGALIVILGMISAYCFTLVGRACSELGARTYRGAWEKGVDESSGWIVTALCGFKTLTGCLAYCIIIGDTATSLTASCLSGSTGLLATLFQRRDVLLTLVGSTMLLPLALMRSLAALAPASVLGLGGMLYTAAVVALRYFDGSYAAGGTLAKALITEGKPLPSFAGGTMSATKSLILVSMLATAFSAHYNAARFHDELADKKDFNKVSYAGFGLAILLFGALTACGFATFGSSSQGFILNSYASADGLASISTAAVGASVACTYPLLFAGLRDYLFDFAPSLRSRRALVTTALVAATVASGIVVRDLGFVVAFGGAVMGSLLIYVIPTKIVLDANKKGKLTLKPFEKVLCTGINVVGWAFAALGGGVCLAKQLKLL